MAESAIQHPGNDFTNLPVGEILKRTRLHYNQSLDDVERSLRIRAEQLEAIEEGQIEKLPGKVYAIGFVRTYSEYLGLDGSKMVELFKAQAAGKTHDPELHFPIAASDSKVPPLWLALLCVMVLGGIIVTWVGMRDEERAIVTEIPEVPETLKAEAMEESANKGEGEQTDAANDENGEQAAAEAETAQTPQEEPAEPPKPKGTTLIIKENSWVEIQTDGNKKILSRVLNQGEEYFIPERDGLTMSIGNAAGIEMIVDGIRVEKVGNKGEVIRNMPLSTEALKKRFNLQDAKPGTLDPQQNSVENPAQ